MAWDYRVVKYSVGPETDREEVFEVCEVYYDDNGVAHSFIKDKNPLNQESIEDLKTTLERISLALQKPVLQWDEKNLTELG
ncbi:hypothetical protein M2277_005032 [Paenibacillus sp. LBL]|uniref:hypothetical protein n=1 Tax=Paenibacillus sp. LBL TaxID=2940563 RepID=UPI002473DC00|nr:hypothetical protein [Paenibacillus sp. LBL]MDH6674340.1 hypothetical protein [Paenibacillus sp. LBL]